MTIKEVYDNWKHADDLLSNPDGDNFIRAEIWVAIKKEVESDKSLSQLEAELREAEKKTAITMARLEKVTADLYEALEEFKKEGWK